MDEFNFEELFGEKALEPTSIESLKHLVKTLREKNEEYELQKRLASDLYKQCEVLEAKVLTILDEHNLKTFKSEYGAVTSVSKFSAPVPKGEDFLIFKDYLKQTNREDLLTCNSASFNKFINELAAEAEERGETLMLPMGVQPPSVRKTLSFRKG